LRRFQAGEPIQARPVGALERGWRWCWRNPAVAGSLAAVALTLLLGTVISSLFGLQAIAEAKRADNKANEAEVNAQQAREETKRADAETRKAQAEKRKTAEQLERAEWAVYVNRITLAHVEWQQGNASATRQYLDGCQRNLR